MAVAFLKSNKKTVEESKAARQNVRKQGEKREKMGRMDLKGATQFIQETIQEAEMIGQERAARNQELVEAVMAGEPGARPRVIEEIIKLLEEYGIEPEGMDRGQCAYEIYKYAWGLGPVEELYRNPEVNEIRVNGPDEVYVLRNIKNEKVNVKFKDDEHVMKIVTRMTMHDRGVALNKSSGIIESMRKDGTRITATCPPITENTTFVLRKHTPRVLTPEELIASGTMDEKTWVILKTLVKGRANILVAGGVGSGKTTFVRTLFSQSSENARTVVLETDRELFLRRMFPSWDIVEMEEHPEIGKTLEILFRTALRYSPNMVLVGEFRGVGEAKEAVRACLRGHNSIATAHFGSPQEAIEGTGRLLLEEKINLPERTAIAMVASAYNIVVQMFGDSTRGVIKVESVTEVVPHHGVMEYIDLIRWIPEEDDYLAGRWHCKNKPSERLIRRLHKYGVVTKELEEACLI
ncbi:ATPase, T2SS/T4P/T4SS family [Moorella naiadis]|uniref:ATPase, T2SS/T4P/T4SS family n=1 Tax=Moorella naiadis (nom. illeg.) TaxID=3093670 RepID=UPI003D9CA0F0